MRVNQDYPDDVVCRFVFGMPMNNHGDYLCAHTSLSVLVYGKQARELGIDQDGDMLPTIRDLQVGTSGAAHVPDCLAANLRIYHTYSTRIEYAILSVA